MIRNRIYFSLKPLLPWSFRISLRRMWARRRRAAHTEVWPIDPKAGTKPPGWVGWPDGRKFAFVLTHDVEGSKGLARVEQLMNLERRYGFRTAFNFVPEWEYRVPDSLRESLDAAGFEVGVHGLAHDGKLYSSKEEFVKKAARIREYLRQWNACGFRSPFMQHNLAWLHELGMLYDASTFDTDPFEPEPDGVGTIFPFWVPGPKGTGYAELPYTLPQDFTLFQLLKEPDIGIWKKKLDWVAERGGMALLNTHPDYMCFSGKPARDEFPVALYQEFLEYAQEKYGTDYWHALPRDVAQHYLSCTTVSSRNTRRRICMVAHTDYDRDNRVRRYAEALTKRGDQVDVIALSWGGKRNCETEIAGVRVFGIQHRDNNEGSKWAYAERLLRFLVGSSIFLTRRHRRVRYDLIHVHNVPDFLVFGAWFAKSSGAKILLDIHDIVPELFGSKFGTAAGSSYIRLLELVEKASASFADHVIVSNHLWRDKLIERSVSREKCSVFVNHVDPGIFYRRPRTRDDGKIIVLFPGTFQWHQGLDIAIKAFTRVKARFPTAEFHLYGGGGGRGTEAELSRLVTELGLGDSVKFCGGVSLNQIADVIANADLGVVPKRANTFGNEAYSTKIMEFMSQGVPVVASRTKIDSFYFNDSIVRFFPSGDHDAMAEAMIEVIENGALRKSMVDKALEYADQNNWDRKKAEYFELVDSLAKETFKSAPVDDSTGAQSISAQREVMLNRKSIE